MGIPSLIYAFLLEGVGSPKVTDRKSYIGTGTVIGFLSSFVYFYALEGLYNDDDVIRIILTSTFIGFIIPLALITIKDKPIKVANKSQ